MTSLKKSCKSDILRETDQKCRIHVIFFKEKSESAIFNRFFELDDEQDGFRTREIRFIQTNRFKRLIWRLC